LNTGTDCCRLGNEAEVRGREDHPKRLPAPRLRGPDSWLLTFLCLKCGGNGARNPQG
jgi:hypothetical protein